MNKKTTLVFIFVLTLFSAEVFSQSLPPLRRVQPVLQDGGNDFGAPEFYRVGDVKGNIGNGKAVVLVKPAFPSEAREVGAEGQS